MKVKIAQLCPTLWDPIYSPWNSPDQNTGVGSLSLLQRIFPTQGSNPGLLHCRQILYQLSHRETQKYWNGQPIPSPADLSNPGIQPALQVEFILDVKCKTKQDSEGFVALPNCENPYLFFHSLILTMNKEFHEQMFIT